MMPRPNLPSRLSSRERVGAACRRIDVSLFDGREGWIIAVSFRSMYPYVVVSQTLL